MADYTPDTSSKSTHTHRPPVLTGDLDLDLKARQILTLSEGFLDAFGLIGVETMRDADKQSQHWLDRQNRKIDGALKAMNALAKAVERESEFLIGNVLTIADIAGVCAVEMLDLRGMREGWRKGMPELARYCGRLGERKTFAETRPVMFDLRQGSIV